LEALPIDGGWGKRVPNKGDNLIANCPSVVSSGKRGEEEE